jgi:glycosyltransferase involved in cell wall biosynthesis
MMAGLETGRGTENVALNLIKYKPKDVEIIVIEPRFTDGKRKSENEIKDTIGNNRIISVDLRPVENRFFVLQLYNLFVKRHILKYVENIQRVNIYNEIRSTDVVYLFYNLYSVFFSDLRIPVIGSLHTDSLEIFAINNHRSFLRGFYFKMKQKIYYKNINGLHLFFDKNDAIIDPAIKYKMILPNGVDTQIYYPNYNTENGRKRCLFNAALSAKKGLDVLLPLIKKFKNNTRIEFHVAGSGEMREEIERDEKIIYHGVLSEMELAKLYKECDIFIYPTGGDTYPLVILQALSSGLYVLTSDIMKGVFDDVEGKYLEYLPRNVDAFYNRLIEILTNNDPLNYDKHEEYNYIQSNYDWKVIANKFYSHIKDFYNENLQANNDL